MTGMASKKASKKAVLRASKRAVLRVDLRTELLEALKAAVRSDVRLTLTAIAAIARCSVATVQAVPHEDLGLRKLSPRSSARPPARPWRLSRRPGWRRRRRCA